MGGVTDKEGFLEATVEQALKRPELRDRFMTYLVRSLGPLIEAKRSGADKTRKEAIPRKKERKA